MEEKEQISQGHPEPEALDPVRRETVETAAVMLSMGWSVEIQTTSLYCALVVKNAGDDEELFLEINHMEDLPRLKALLDAKLKEGK